MAGMTNEELNAIEQRCNAATEGPWEMCASSIVKWEGGMLAAEWIDNSGMPREQLMADGAFIAHAREDVPRLIAEVKRLRFALQEVIAALGPVPATCCDGCNTEMAIALEAAKKAMA